MERKRLNRLKVVLAEKNMTNKLGYQCGPAKCRNAHSHLEIIGSECGRFIVDRIKFIL